MRDLLLARPVTDVDLVVDDDAEGAARSLGERLRAAVFPLSERHGAWRVMGGGRTVDITAWRGSLVDDLGMRDFTVNAIAIPLDGGEPLDPFDGRRDLDRRLLRTVSSAVFDDDPLRLLRLVRISREVDLEIDPDAADLARSKASLADRPSGERIFMEMRRLLACDDPADGIRLLEQLGLLAVVLPELATLRGVPQNPHHHLDVLDHTLLVLDGAADIADHPGFYLPAHEAMLTDRLKRVVGDDMTAGHALRMAALFHDVGKPLTRTEREPGWHGFKGHDTVGAELTATVMRRWKTSTSLRRFCSVLVREHLRLGFTIPRRPLDRRAAHVYRRATDPWSVESVLLSLADRLATRGLRARPRHLRVHHQTADEMLTLLEELRRDTRPPLLRGDEIARVTGASGSAIAELVEALAEEQAAGTVTTAEQAERFVVEHAAATAPAQGAGR